MPITTAVYNIIYGGGQVKKEIVNLSNLLS
jgi:glycerol-3-phosphate dehydrogenase